MAKGYLRVPEERVCVDCESTFHRTTTGSRPERCSPCRADHRAKLDREKAAVYRARHPEVDRARKEARRVSGGTRNDMLKNRYGITSEEYGWMLSFQAGVCAVCKTDEAGKSLAVDHCHKTGRVRGLLCRRCNMALGAFHDDADRIRRAAAYLIEWQAKHAAMRAAV